MCPKSEMIYREVGHMIGKSETAERGWCPDGADIDREVGHAMGWEGGRRGGVRVPSCRTS